MGPISSVAVIVQPNVEHFGLGSLAEVWDEPYHPEDDNPLFDFTVCAAQPGIIAGASGFDVVVHHGLEATETADLILVAAHRDHTVTDPAVIEALRAAHARGALIVASCTAVFALGAAGLLAGRRVTTHWRYGDELAAAYPEATVDTGVLYIQDGSIITGAGSAAALDTSLFVMRQAFGAATAATTARRMVVPPHRDGGQAQFVKAPQREVQAPTLAPVLDWIRGRLEQPCTVAQMAERASMSERTFARRFRDETGTSPWNWLTAERVALAEELLETTGMPVDEVARRVGFGNPATLRHHFVAARGVSPSAYRRSFTCPDVASA